VFAIVQIGKVTAFVCISKEHSKQAVIIGRITRACPLKPIVCESSGNEEMVFQTGFAQRTFCATIHNWL
jgi:hypothetical protein